MNKLLRLIVVTSLITVGSASALLQGSPSDDFAKAHQNLMAILTTISKQASSLNSIYAQDVINNIRAAMQQATFANAECQPLGSQVVDNIHVMLLQFLGKAHSAAGNIGPSISSQIEDAKQAAWNANQACHAYLSSLPTGA